MGRPARTTQRFAVVGYHLRNSSGLKRQAPPILWAGISPRSAILVTDRAVRPNTSPTSRAVRWPGRSCAVCTSGDVITVTPSFLLGADPRPALCKGSLMPDRHSALRHHPHPPSRVALLGLSGAGRRGDRCNTRTRHANSATPLGKFLTNARWAAQNRWSQVVANYTTVTCVKRNRLRNVKHMSQTTNALAVIARLAGRPPILQKEVAEVLGINPSNVSRRIKGGWNMEDLLAVADHYGVPRYDLMLQLGYLPAADKYEVEGDGSLTAVPLEVLVAELERRARAGEQKD